MVRTSACACAQVPTVDTVRNSFVGSTLVRNFTHTLIVGNVGVGKTMIVQSMLANLPSDRCAPVRVLVRTAGSKTLRAHVSWAT